MCAIYASQDLGELCDLRKGDGGSISSPQCRREAYVLRSERAQGVSNFCHNARRTRLANANRVPYRSLEAPACEKAQSEQDLHVHW